MSVGKIELVGPLDSSTLLPEAEIVSRRMKPVYHM